MSNALQHDWRISPEEYLAGEELAASKHEYVGGLVYAMSGARNRQNTISVNIIGELLARLRGTGYRPCNSDTKVRIHFPGHQRFYYPDVMIVCHHNPPDEVFQDEPVVIFEVLSPSTQRVDCGEKADAYRSIPSLKAYVIVESEHIGLTVHCRDGDGWKIEILSAPSDLLDLPGLNCCLALETIYAESGLEELKRPPPTG